MKRMIHTTRILSGMMAIALLSGCSGSELPDGSRPDTPSSAAIPLEITSGSLSAVIDTRATTTLGDNEQIGIFLSGAGYADINNRPYTRTSGTWGPDGGISNTIYLGGSTAQLCAYHPYQGTDAKWGNKEAIPLTSRPWSAAADLSYAIHRDMDNSNPSTAFVMSRAYARLTVSLERDTYPRPGAVAGLSISNLLESATLNITKNSGNYSANTGTAGFTLTTGTAVSLLPSGQLAYADYLLVPCTPAAGAISLSLTVDGITMTTTVPVASYSPEAGKQKNINLKVQGTGIVIGSVTTGEWAEQSSVTVIPEV